MYKLLYIYELFKWATYNWGGGGGGGAFHDIKFFSYFILIFLLSSIKAYAVHNTNQLTALCSAEQKFLSNFAWKYSQMIKIKLN